MSFNKKNLTIILLFACLFNISAGIRGISVIPGKNNIYKASNLNYDNYSFRKFKCPKVPYCFDPVVMELEIEFDYSYYRLPSYLSNKILPVQISKIYIVVQCSKEELIDDQLNQFELSREFVYGTNEIRKQGVFPYSYFSSKESFNSKRNVSIELLQEIKDGVTEIKFSRIKDGCVEVNDFGKKINGEVSSDDIFYLDGYPNLVKKQFDFYCIAKSETELNIVFYTLVPLEKFYMLSNKFRNLYSTGVENIEYNKVRKILDETIAADNILTILTQDNEI